MHGLINRSIQCFLRDTYGVPLWAAVARRAELGFDSFEAMLTYDMAQTEAVIAAAVHLLDRPRETLLEDLGTYLVSHPNVDALRRLLRFGGVTFVDFLHSLEDLPGRGRLALPDLELPTLVVTNHTAEYFTLRCWSPLPGIGHVFLGLLRAMADDYGALVLLEYQGFALGSEEVSIHLLESRFASGRRFELAARAG